MDRRALFALLGCAAFAAALAPARTATAAEPVSFEAQIESDQVVLGQTVQLTVQIVTSDAGAHPRYTPPEVPDFEILQVTPQQSTQWTIDPVHGQQVKRVEATTYVLRPKRKGTLRIGEAKLILGGRTYMTRPLTVHVVEARATPQGGPPQGAAPPGGGRSLLPPGAQPRAGGDEVFLDATADKTKAYVGEQIGVAWYLYTQSDVLKYRTVTEPKTEGFWVEDRYLATNLAPYDRAMVRGQEYSVRTLLRRALFPLQAGKLIIGSMESEVTTFTTAFYGTGGSLKKTAPLTIEVMPLPAGAPAGFDAANVGRFSLTASVDRERVAAGEPVTLKVVVTGQGNLRNLRLRKIAAAAGFKVYEPKVTEQLDPGDLVQGTKSYEILLVAQRGGQLELPQAELAYFDPYAKRYEVARSPHLSVQVVGDVAATAGAAAGAAENVLAPAIRTLRPTKTLRSRVGATMYRQRYFPPLLVAPVALYLFVLLFEQLRARLRRETPRARLRRARWRARRRFRAAEYHIRTNRPGPFYGEIARVLTDHLEERLSTPVAAMTLGELRAFLLDRGFPDEMVDRIAKELEACDFARFAPTASGPNEMRASLRRSRELLQEIERAEVREAAA